MLYDYMNRRWLERQLEEIDDDKNETIVFETMGSMTHMLLDSLTKCYGQPETMDN